MPGVDPRHGAGRCRPRADPPGNIRGDAVTPAIVARFDEVRRKRKAMEGGGYWHGHSRALAQRVEVGAQREGASMKRRETCFERWLTLYEGTQRRSACPAWTELAERVRPVTNGPSHVFARL